MLPSKIYDVLKWTCIIALPAVSTLYAGLCAVWKLPYANEIPQTITLIATFLGVLLGVSKASYNEKVKTKNDVEKEG
mgnify:FL=1